MTRATQHFLPTSERIGVNLGNYQDLRRILELCGECDEIAKIDHITFVCAPSERDAFLDLFADWRSSAEYDYWHDNEEADQWSSWEGESDISDYETRVEEMYGCCDGAGEPDDPDDPYGGADLGYDGVDQMRNEFACEFGPPCWPKRLL